MGWSTRSLTSCLLLILSAMWIVVGRPSCADRRSAARSAEPVAEKAHPILTPAQALATFRLPEGFVIRLVAAEPDLVNPISMTVDRQGRIFASLSHTYRYGAKGTPVEPPTNPVVRLELGADGRVARRTTVTSGFADPVMGLAVRGNRLWATNLDRLLVAELDGEGHAGPPRVIVQDEETPWNPFGMYRIGFGPDGLLYLTVGDHPIHLKGPTNEVTVRGATGALFRMQPDGSNIELAVQGMRAPFACDIDPFGRLWILSNGEGNPNRLIHAIWGADYHFQTRPVDWAWLAGRDPLAPPVWENPPGAHTAVVVYVSDSFPSQYWGNLFVSNWGAHGFPSAQHVILRHCVDRRGRLVATEPFLTTTDPRFRPTQITLAPDGGLYVLDWYGRDDDSDLTGRLYKISYIGDSRNRSGEEETSATLPGVPGEEERLSSRRHSVRQRVRRELLDEGPAATDRLVRWVTSSDPLGAAEALWVAREGGWPEAHSIVEKGLVHNDWRVRRLAVRLLTEMHGDAARNMRMVEDSDPAVALEAAIGLKGDAERSAVLYALRHGAAADRRLRYRGALALARIGDVATFTELLHDDDSDVRLAGLIALDEAFHEGVVVAVAREVLVREMTRDDQAVGPALGDILALGRRWPFPKLRQPTIERLKRDVSPRDFAAGLEILRQLGTELTHGTLSDAVEHLLERVVAGDVPVATREEKLYLLDVVAVDGPGPTSRTVLDRAMRDADAVVRMKAHHVLVTIGGGDAACVELCWDLVNDASSSVAVRIDAVASLAQIETGLRAVSWRELLAAKSPQLALAAFRSLRHHTDRPAAVGVLASVEQTLAARGPRFESELDFLRKSGAMTAETAVERAPTGTAQAPATDHATRELRKRLLANYRSGDSTLGRLSFRVEACGRCHLGGGRDVQLGPSLDGIADLQKVEYLVDSVLFPSQVIKTGFMTEMVVTDDGRVLTGKVTREGDDLIVTPALGDPIRVPIDAIEERKRTNLSLMPELLETTMSEPELTDLIAYLNTLRAGVRSTVDQKGKPSKGTS
ncbi:MAG: hypothetical protein ACC645_08980 [Pirellulales bacterium]